MGLPCTFGESMQVSSGEQQDIRPAMLSCRRCAERCSAAVLPSLHRSAANSSAIARHGRAALLGGQRAGAERPLHPVDRAKKDSSHRVSEGLVLITGRPTERYLPRSEAKEEKPARLGPYWCCPALPIVCISTMQRHMKAAEYCGMAHLSLAPLMMLLMMVHEPHPQPRPAD